MEDQKSLLTIAKEFEWKQFLDAFTASSNRVRYIMIVVVVATFFCMISWEDSRDASWISQRVDQARKAIHYEVWDPNSKFSSKEDFAKAKGWAEDYGLYGKDLLMSYLSKLEDMEAQNSYTARVPFVGIAFDINDLGAITGSSFLFLMLVLLISVMRQHENQYLCLWRVARVNEDEKSSFHGRSSKSALPLARHGSGFF